MDRARVARPFPSPERLGAEPLRAVPQISSPKDPNSSPAAAIDIATLARQGSALAATPPAEDRSKALQIFITLDMPRGSLQRLVDQADRAGATLVLRGLKAQSMRQTIAAASELIGNRRVSWVIDPNAFQRFQVTVAPSFVLLLPQGAPTGSMRGVAPATELPRCTGSSCASPAHPSEYLLVAGDVSLDYALNAMQRRSVDAAPHVTPLLQRLRTP